MLGNPVAIGAGKFRPILTNHSTVSYHNIRSNHTRITGAPATHRRRIPTQKCKWVVHCVASAPSAKGYPEYDRLLPCPPTNPIDHPPRVEHLVVLEEGPVCDYVSRTLNLPPLYVADLIHFGAVYYALVHPKPPATATPEQIQVYEEFTSPCLLKQRQSLEGKTVSEAQKTFRITHIDEHVEVGTYLRVYVNPRRFPRCYEIDWKSRIIAITDNYVILDKPAGTSVGGTSNNLEESCAKFATRALGLTSPLLTVHQIDNSTEGCVVMARTEEYGSILQENFREKKVKKLYRALVAAPISCGIITHYMQRAKFAPRIVSEEYVKGWQLCQLEVLDCKEVSWPNPIIEEKYQIEDCGWPVKNFAYECKINLLTGRTHQIRAQLAASGAPVIGDSMYMPAVLAELTKPGVFPFGKYKRAYSGEDDERIAIENWISLHGKEPSLAIGLQACQISWDDDNEHVYVAGSPWWR